MVLGVPKTIDGDLKNSSVAISFGFDTACKVSCNLAIHTGEGNPEVDMWTDFCFGLGPSFGTVVPSPAPLRYKPERTRFAVFMLPCIPPLQCKRSIEAACLMCWPERERDLLPGTHISLWGHSSHDRLIRRGVPGVSFVSR